ncbi:MAG: hypothetical protein ACI4RT_05380 [Candidatus Spyradenecus sp.]
MKPTLTDRKPARRTQCAPSLRFVFLCVSLCFFVVKSRVALASESETPPTPFRYMLLTDGAEVWPKDTLATNAQVENAQSEAQSAAAQITAQQAQVVAIGERLSAVESTLADLSKDGVWVLEGYINSIGLLSGTPEYAGTIEIVHLTVTDSATTSGAKTLTLYAAFSPAPTTASQVAMVGNSSLKDEFGDLTYTSSYPETVPNPKDATDTRAIYTFSADYAGATGFAKIVSLPGTGVGVGNYLPVSGGLSINGINGATATLTADDGTVLTFKGGILVEAEPVTLTE